MSQTGSFHPVAQEYDPLKAGSIDGTDTEPHDHGIIRALRAKYKPNKGVKGDPSCTVFVGRLNHSTTEDSVRELFSRFGNVVQLRVVRDLVTGFHKGYAFVEYSSSTAAYKATIEANKVQLDDKEILVEMECERTLKNWVPRRLGGGLSGRRESGQLRFGGRDRPFRKPIILPTKDSDSHAWSSDRGSEHDREGKWDKTRGRSPVRRRKSRSRSRERNHWDKRKDRDRESRYKDRDREDRSRDDRRDKDRERDGSRRDRDRKGEKVNRDRDDRTGRY